MVTDWRPIETAPKDGTSILIWENGPSIAAWSEEADLGEFKSGPAWQVFACDDGWYSYSSRNPTHWMPLPEPPK